MNASFLRLPLLALLGLLAYFTYQELRKPSAEDYLESHTAELITSGKLLEGELPTSILIPPGQVQRPLLLFGLFIGLAASVGFGVVKWILPAVGDAIGTAAFGGGGAGDPSPHERGIELMQAGQHAAAITEFQRVLAQNPVDRYAVLQIVKLQATSLEDPESAIQSLQVALLETWPEAETALFTDKLVDLLLETKQAPAAARTALETLISQHPGTIVAGQAQARIQALEEAAYLAGSQALPSEHGWPAAPTP